MENFAKKCKWSFLLTAVGLFAFFSCGKLDKTENLVDLQESFVRGEVMVDITGTVTDPITCLPIAGATVAGASFGQVTTDPNGNFSIPAANVSESELITVSKDGHIDYSFPVGYAGLTSANWTIGLPTRQDCVWVGPNEGAWYRITVSGVEYIIDIRRGSVDAWTQVCVGPGGTAFGNGIPLAFATTGLSTETPGATDVVFNSPIDVRYDGASSITSKGGIGSIGEATLAAALAAANGGSSAVFAAAIAAFSPNGASVAGLTALAAGNAAAFAALANAAGLTALAAAAANGDSAAIAAALGALSAADRAALLAANNAASAADAGNAANGALLTAIGANLDALIASGASAQEIGDALFGAGNFEISPSGQFVTFIPLPAALIPSAGFLTPAGNIVIPAPDGGGVIVAGPGEITDAQVVDILTAITENPEILGTPDHQGTGGG